MSCLDFGLFGVAWGCEVVRALGLKGPRFPGAFEVCLG